MSLIPFILDLAEELHDFNRSWSNASMDIDDVGFGMYPVDTPPSQQQQQQTQHSHPQLSSSSPSSSRRSSRLATPTFLSPLCWVPIKGQQSLHRHHPYGRAAGAKTACCNKSLLEVEKELNAATSSSSSNGTTINTTSGAGAGPGGVASVSQQPPASIASKSAYSVVNRNGFQVSMNVKQFLPEELTVKTIDNCVVVEGHHDEKEDGHGVISRHFIRKYMLPKGFDPNDVHSTLSSDGILTVKAPPPPPPVAKNGDERMERVIAIQQSGEPAQLHHQANKADAQMQKPLASSSSNNINTNSNNNNNNDGGAATPVAEEKQPPTAAVAAAAVATAAVGEKKSAEESNANGVDETATTTTNMTAKKETETEPMVVVAEIANGNANGGTAQPPPPPPTTEKQQQQPMEIVDAADDAGKTGKEATATVTTTTAEQPQPQQSDEDANANDVVVAANNGTVAPVAVPVPLPGNDVDMEKLPPKGAEELAAVDAAILLAKNNQNENGTTTKSVGDVGAVDAGGVEGKAETEVAAN